MKNTQSALKSLRSTLNQDEVYLKYRSIIKNCQALVSTDAILSEAKLLHSKRKARLLSSGRLSVKSLEEAMTMDISNRSRLIELKILVFRQRELVSTTLDRTKSHVNTVYRDMIKSIASNVSTSNSLLNKIFNSGVEIRDNLTTAIEELDFYIKDIDQTGYSTTNLTSLLKLAMDRKEYV